MTARRFAALLLLPLAIVAAGSSPSAADLGGFHITRFDVDVQVLENSDLVVEERIEVSFSESRHGIYRDLPIRYTDPRGYQYGYDFQLLGVTDEEGDRRQVKVSREGPMVRLRIGSPDRSVNGTQVYVLRYRARDVLRQFGDRDELYWNVTGHQWDTSIGEASVHVRFPAGVDLDAVDVQGWAGGYGGREPNIRYELRSPDEVSIRSTIALEPRQGLTVALAWPSGAVTFPGPVARVWRFVQWNGIVLVPLLALIFLIRRYRTHGRDPEAPPSVMVRYEPPPGVSAGSIGTLVDEKVDMVDITATIVDLAVRGHLTIRTEVEEQFWGLKKTDVTSFTRNPEAHDQDLLPHERLILKGLFASDPSSVTTEDLKEAFYTRIPAIRSALYDRLVERKLVAGSPQHVRRVTVGLGFLAGVVTFIGGMFWAGMQGAIFPNAALLPVLSAIATSLLFFFFAPAMPRRTKAGVQALSWARGFQEFAQRVEEDRFERDAARGIYESLLPYAMALGVATKWSRQFEGIYDDEPPRWYVGPSHSGHRFSTASFHNSLQHAMSQTGTSLASAPRSSGSSGSGGGGFSGGGGGGGGGGSW